jgi:formylglycine-generating enzyme required for sulfatase activity
MYKNLVTVAQYRGFCQATGRSMPDAPPWGWHDDHPIVNVSWDDAKAYAKWAGVSLPTEAQWEKAARGTDGREYPWGNDWDASKCRCSKTQFGDAGSTSPVGSYPAGGSPYGCLDMAGNVCEWCADRYGQDYYASSPARNPTGPESGDRRVLRGGSWNDYNATLFRSAFRNYINPSRGIQLLFGFRCAARAGSH